MLKRASTFIRPEFFDIFGIFVWLFFIAVSLNALITDNIPRWTLFAILVIAVLGFLVDGVIVYKTYVRKKNA